MEPIDAEAEYAEILKVLKEHGGEMEYKTLNEALADKFEGIRLRLKTMKEKGLVSFEGIVPSFSSIIRLAKK
jgi:repressor of nif and glnA expression